jgi:hypothetical protein
MTFDEDEAFKISRESHMDEDREEWEAQRDAYMVDSTLQEHILEDQNETVEPERPIDPPKEAIVSWKRPAWLRTLCRKLKEMQLQRDPLEKARDHTSFPAMWR